MRTSLSCIMNSSYIGTSFNLSSYINVNGSITTVSVQYGSSSGVYTYEETNVTNSPLSSNGTISATLTGLTGNTYFRIKAVNTSGIAYSLEYLALTGTPINGLIAWWKLDETTLSTAIDSYGTYNMGIIGTPTVNQIGILNTSYLFSANSGQYLYNSNIPLVNSGKFSIGAWIKTTSTNNGELYIVGDRNGTTPYKWAYLELYSGYTRFIIRGSTIITVSDSGTTDLRNGNWHFVAGTYDEATNMNLYVDGILVGSAAGTTLGWTNIPMGIANHPSNVVSTRTFDGYIDEVSNANDVWTQNNITNMWNNGNGISMESVSSYWRLSP